MDFDHEWLEENFMTREVDLYNNNDQKQIRSDDTKTYQLFAVIIFNAKITDEIQFHPEELGIKITKIRLIIFV